MDAAIHEVNQLLGEAGVQPTTPSAAMATVYKSILSVDRRYMFWKKKRTLYEL